MSIQLPNAERVSLAEIAKIAKIALVEKHTVSTLASESVCDMLARKNERAEWLTSCKEADRHMNETGLHVTHAEVMNWLDSLATPHALRPPQCHQ